MLEFGGPGRLKWLVGRTCSLFGLREFAQQHFTEASSQASYVELQSKKSSGEVDFFDRLHR